MNSLLPNLIIIFYYYMVSYYHTTEKYFISIFLVGILICLTDRKTNKPIDRHRITPNLELENFPSLADSQSQNSSHGSQLPKSKYFPWESTPRVNFLPLGVGPQGQNTSLGSRLPGSIFYPWESAPKVKILPLGVDSQELGSHI